MSKWRNNPPLGAKMAYLIFTIGYSEHGEYCYLCTMATTYEQVKALDDRLAALRRSL